MATFTNTCRLDCKFSVYSVDMVDETCTNKLDFKFHIVEGISMEYRTA